MRPLSGKTLRYSNPASMLGMGILGNVEHEKSVWLGRLRWFAALAQILCGILGIRYGLLRASDIPVYFSVVGLLVAFNIVWPTIRIRFAKATRIPAVFFEMGFDLISLGILLSVTDGCSNPLYAIIYLHAALGPLMLSAYWSKAYLILTIVCLGRVCLGSEILSHAGLHSGHLPRELRLAAELFVVLVIWGLTYWVSSLLNSSKQTIVRLQRQKQRGDHLRALGAMAASFSHEFSTPLNTAKIRAERLARRHAQVNSDADYKAVVSALDQCESTLRCLFDSDQRLGVANFDKIELKTFVGQVCKRWQESKPEIPLKFNHSLSDTDITCKIPQIVLARSIIDLLDNAAQSSDTLHSPIDVQVFTKHQKAHVVISDRGRGVTQFIKERLGDPFLSTREDGVGLGLFTANAMMEALGGLFRIDDRTNGGTVVTLEFPI